MEIVYSRNLAEYLLGNGRPHIIIESSPEESAHGVRHRLKARAVSDDEMAFALPRAKAAYRGFIGRVLVMANGLELGDKLELGLHSLFGSRSIPQQTVLS